MMIAILVIYCYILHRTLLTQYDAGIRDTFKAYKPYIKHGTFFRLLKCWALLPSAIMIGIISFYAYNYVLGEFIDFAVALCVIDSFRVVISLRKIKKLESSLI